MSLRVLVVLLGLLLGAAIFLAADAAATPAQRDAALAGTDQWISLVLHVPIAERDDVPGAVGELSSLEGGVPCDAPGEAHYDPYLLAAAANRHALDFETAWNTVLHEHLHLRGGLCVYELDLSSDPPKWRLDPEWLFWEEGFVDAARADLFPAFFRAMFGRRALGDWTAAMARYVPNVAAVRAASQYATGSATWRSREARLWRRRGLLADWPARQAMVAAAVAARG